MAKLPVSVGIVVPVLNERTVLPSLISNLVRLGADELVIVDGGSTDGSQALLSTAGVSWVASPSGRAMQMNSGASHLQSDVLLFLHADTSMTPEHVDDIRSCMDGEGGIGGRFDVRITGTHPLLPVIARMMNLRSRLTRISTGDQAMFVRRSVFERLGGFPVQPLMEDIELSRRLKPLGKICCLSRKVATSGRRWQQLGVVRTILLMWRMRLLYWLGISPERLASLYREVR